MGTVREEFDLGSRALTVHRDATFQTPAGESTIEIVERAHADFESGARYVSFFIPDGPLWAHAIKAALRHAGEVADLFASAVEARMSHPALPDSEISAKDLPFTGRVHMYVDVALTDADCTAIVADAHGLGLLADVRDRRYVAEIDRGRPPEAFISYTATDARDVAGALAMQLATLGCRVWYDEFAVKVGDSLSDVIDKGNRACKYCVLIVSPALIENRGWAEREFKAIVQRELGEGRNLILPVWHGVNRDEVGKIALWLTDRKAISTGSGEEAVVRELLRSIRS